MYVIFELNMKTKTIWITCGLFLFTGFRLNAQEFKYGFLVGYDITKISFTDMPDNQNYTKYYPMISFNVNGYIRYKCSGIVGLSLEPGFIRKGSMIKLPFQEGKISHQRQYLQMPVLVDLYFTNQLFLSVGPEIAYMLNNEPSINHFELSGIIGLNYKINEKVDVGFRYNHGLTYTREFMYTNDLGLLISKPKEFNLYFQLIVRYKI